jgi:TRAP-type uncharacterized transport system fused permease subunit
MLQPGDPMAAELGFYGAVAYSTIKALISIGLFGMVAIGYLFARMTLLERVVSFLAALCLLGEFQYSDWVGFVLAFLIVGWQWRQRSSPVAATA